MVRPKSRDVENYETLMKWVGWLRGEQIIKYNKDISTDTGISKATVSAALTGKARVTAGFISDFEETYLTKRGFRFSDYEKIAHKSEPDELTNQLLTLEAMLRAVLDQNREIIEQNKLLISQNATLLKK
jgi:hypothetical protein